MAIFREDPVTGEVIMFEDGTTEEEIQERLLPHKIKVCSDKDRNGKFLSTFLGELKID